MASRESLAGTIEARSPGEIEKRCGNVISLTEGRFGLPGNENAMAFYRTLHAHALKNSYTELDLETCIDLAQKQLTPGTFPHLLEIIENSVFVVANTFGADEPSYLEALGPEGILKLHAIRAPRFLLLGSLGKYSARNFSSYAKKINPRASSTVIEVNSTILKLATRNGGTNMNAFVMGDARAMPIMPGTVNHICSNHLFHFLQFLRGRHDMGLSEIRNVVRETFRILAPGGNFVLVEQRYGRFKDDTTIPLEEMRKEISEVAISCGFEAIKTSHCFSFALTKEVGQCSIDETGLPHYGNSLLFDDLHDVVVMKLEKPT